MKVNIGYLNCYDSILGLNLIKIFITPNIKCVFFSKNMARYRYGLILQVDIELYGFMACYNSSYLLAELI